MSKDRSMQQQSIEDAMAVDRQDSNEGDNQTILFRDFLLDKILNNVQHVPFDTIITTHLMNEGSRGEFNVMVDEIRWFYTADRRTLRGRTIFIFRFPNLCNPDSYKEFELACNPLFVASKEIGHGVDGWYEYSGFKLPAYVNQLVPIAEVRNGEPRTRIFVNKQYERTDIVFNLDSTNRRIILTFERADPARPHQLIS